MTKDHAIRVAALAQAIIDAKDWRETFDDPRRQKPSHAIVAFGEGNCMQASIDAGTMHAFDGWLRMPRDIAIEMMQWLDERAARELQKAQGKKAAR